MNQAGTSLFLVHGAILQQLPFSNICYVSWVLQPPCSGARVKPTTGEGSPLSWGFCSSGGNLELHLEMDVTHPGTLSPGPRCPSLGTHSDPKGETAHYARQVDKRGAGKPPSWVPLLWTCVPWDPGLIPQSTSSLCTPGTCTQEEPMDSSRRGLYSPAPPEPAPLPIAPHLAW